MAQLIAQVIGLVLAAMIVHRLAVQNGARMDLPRAVALVVAVLLAVLATVNFREGWHVQNDRRAKTAGQSPEAARQACASVGVDVHFIGWLRARIPDRARYVLDMPDALERAGGHRCAEMLLLPRIPVAEHEDAEFVVLWDVAPGSLPSELGRRGAGVELFKQTHRLVRIR